MTPFRLTMGRKALAAGLLLGLTLAAATPGAAAEFPYNQELMLEAAPMPPSRRVPVISIEGDGSATIFLWCQTVRGHFEINGSAVRLAAGPVPAGMPAYMSPGQCTPERIQADQAVLAQLTQVTGWRRQGGAVVFDGPTPLRFRISDH